MRVILKMMAKRIMVAGGRERGRGKRVRGCKWYHWILTIINEDKNMIYLLDSLSNRNRDHAWQTIVTNGVKIYNASRGISKGSGFKQLTGNLKQNGGVECGYCVMRYMKEIVMDEDLQLERKKKSRKHLMAASKIQALWNHPAGPKTIHFWAPTFKWGISIANVADFSKPPENISYPQQFVVACTGVIWSRYSTIITPKNWNLFSVSVGMAGTGLYQLSRKIRHDYLSAEEKEPLKEH